MADLARQIRGLTSAEVDERMERGESNRFVARPTRTYSQILWANVFNLYNIILLGSFLVLFLIRGPGASIFPAAVVLTNMILGIVQEVRAKSALDKLATLSIRTVTVRRDGQTLKIPIEAIVCEDVIELTPGDSVVADGPVLASESLEIDESQLTGESEYVPKQEGEAVHSGSFCISGRGLMQAQKIGRESYVNQLAEVARAYKNVRTPLEQELDAMLKVLILVMAVLAPLTLLNGFVRAYALGDSFENVVNLISSLVPQGLIVFVAISFTFGVINISRYKALIQRPNAIESIGHVTCLCVDKTGTLTHNFLTVQRIQPLHGETLESVQAKLGIYTEAISWQNRTVAAIAAAVRRPERMPSKTGEIPFNSQRKWSSVAFSSGQVFLLGTPELLLKDTQNREEAGQLSRQGLRVVVFAESTVKSGEVKPSLPDTWNSLALIALEDQLRIDICETLNDFTQQGVAIKVISGDSPETVTAVAKQACMGSTTVLSGPEVDALDEQALAEAVRKTNLFARITPQTKRKIIASLAKGRDYVAMIGDGVNDVPALKQAHIAIAMNDGAQVDKDIADITLLNNAFSTLPRAFREGRELTRRLYGVAKINLVKVVYLTLLFVLTGFIGYGWPANLIQTTWLSLITLTPPALLIIFRVLPTPAGKSESHVLLRYILTWGIVGAVAMILLEVIVQTGLHGNLALSRTMVIAFAGIFNSIVLWDVYGITPFSPRSFLADIRSSLAGFILGAVVALVPVYLLTKSLGFERLHVLHWLILFVLLAAAYVSIQWISRRSQHFL